MIGKTISHYTILEKLGEGGMGVVYKARDTKLDRTVALKFLSPQTLGNKEDKTRFVREAKSAAALNHPNICTVHEIDEVEGQTFIAIELVEGVSLKDRMASAPLSLHEALDVAGQIGEGLQAAHAKGIVHRDIKPANIMISADGRVKIMDFGLAKSHLHTTLTKEAATLGTVAYMSPEQARGDSVDPRTDIWSLGVVLYEMMTGLRPFRGDYDQAVVYSILNEEPVPISSLRDDVPESIDAWIRKAIAKNADVRYPTIERMLADAPAARSPSTPSHTDRAHAPPPPRKRKRLYLYAGISALLLILLAWQSGWFTRRPTGIDSVAVLPLENLSGDPDQEYFADGMTEALITELSRIKALRVISRTSVMQYKKARRPLPEIARELGVDAVVEGSAMRSGDRIRISAQLIEAASDRHLWAESYERELRDVLALQKEVALAVTEEIRIALTPEERAVLADARPIEPGALEAYMKGRFLLNQWTEESVRRAITFFERAVAKDRDYAPAFAALAEAYDTLISFRWMPPSEGWPKVKAHALRALEIDPTLAQAHTVLADERGMYEWDFAAAEKDFLRAIDANPNNAMAHHWYAYFLSSLGRHEEALREIRLAERLDPLSIGVRRSVGTILDLAGQHDAAIRYLQETLALDPDFAKTRQSLAAAYENKEMWPEAIGEIEENGRLSPDSLWVASLARIYARNGQTGKARELLDALIRQSQSRYVPPTDIATVLGFLGDKDGAFSWLDRACEERSPYLIWLKVHPVYDPLRSDPRFAELLRKVGLET